MVTEFGYDIIKVVDIRSGDGITFEDKKAEVEEDIRTDAYNRLVKSLRDKARVKISDDVD